MTGEELQKRKAEYAASLDRAHEEFKAAAKMYADQARSERPQRPKPVQPSWHTSNSESSFDIWGPLAVVGFVCFLIGVLVGAVVQ